MRDLVFSPAAQADIAAIWDYTVDMWGPDQAVRYNTMIEAACVDLANGRQSGRSVFAVRDAYHLLHVGKHSVYFRRNEEQIEVVRILHQRMDVADQLR
jgi:toxin ParE1/3/4